MQAMPAPLPPLALLSTNVTKETVGLAPMVSMPPPLFP